MCARYTTYIICMYVCTRISVRDPSENVFLKQWFFFFYVNMQLNNTKRASYTMTADGDDRARRTINNIIPSRSRYFSDITTVKRCTSLYNTSEICLPLAFSFTHALLSLFLCFFFPFLSHVQTYRHMYTIVRFEKYMYL